MRPAGQVLYDDGTILCDDTGITIRWYYFPFAINVIEYARIVQARERSMGWNDREAAPLGSATCSTGYNLDWRRPRKETAIVIDQAVGKSGHHPGEPRPRPVDPERENRGDGLRRYERSAPCPRKKRKPGVRDVAATFFLLL